MSEYLYGGTPLAIKIKNLPHDTVVDRVKVEFHVNVTAKKIDFSQGLPVVSVQIPRSSTALKIPLTIYLLDLRVTLTIESGFEFLPVPSTSITRVLPEIASIISASRIRVSVKNFPMVLAPSEVKVRFKWQSDLENAVVLSTSSSRLRAVEDIDIDIQTPLGPNVQAGKPDVIVFHQRFGESSTTTVLSNAFSFYDPLLPSVSRISTSKGVAESEASVPMSAPVIVSMVVSNSPREISVSTYSVQVDGMTLNIQSAQISMDREARVVFSTFPKSKTGVLHGIISFGEACSSACCFDGSCSEACAVKSACFTLNYFDDTMPSLTLLSDQSGPQIGGDLIRLQITNFPQVSSGSQVSVSFIFQGAPGYIQDFEIVSSDSETTELLLVTPEFSGLESDQSISISVEPASDPRKTVSFFYLIEMVQPEIVFYSPSAGLATGGSSILVDIKYFPHPTQVLVKFNELILPGEDVEILSSSDKTRTKVRLTTPDSDPGLYEVTIVPKTCSELCAQAVHFQFEQVDASVPRLVQPIPTESSFQKAFLPLIYLENLPVDLDGATISAKFVGTDVSADVPLGLSDFYESAMAGVMAVSISIPATIAKQGSFFVTVTFALSSGITKTTEPFMIDLIDGLRARVVSASPRAVPIGVRVAGRKVEMNSKISVTIANFPQGISNLASIVALLRPLEQTAKVIEVRDFVSCKQLQPDCNRSLVVLETPSVDYPGLQSVEISQVAGKSSVMLGAVNLEFVPPCDFATFCQDSRLLPNLKRILEKPSIACSSEFCIDPTLISDPVLVSFSPSEGPVSGGTLVNVRIRNLPAFSPDEVAVVVKDSETMTQFVSPTSLVMQAGSSLTSSLGELSFVTPQFTSDDEFATIEIEVQIAGLKKSTSFQFEYMPAITGPAVLEEYSPKQIFSGQHLVFYAVLTNVPRLKFSKGTFVPHEMHVLVCGEEVESTSIYIVSSDRYSTSLRFTLEYSKLSTTMQDLEVRVGNRGQGKDTLGTANIMVMQTPPPSLISSYPPQDAEIPSNIVNNIELRIAYLPPDQVSQGIISAELSFGDDQPSYSVGVKPPVRMMDEACVDAYCSGYRFMLIVPVLNDYHQSTGGTGNITISMTSSESVILQSLSFDFSFRASGSPSLEQLLPNTFDLSGGNIIMAYLKNFPNAQCKNKEPPSCEEEALAGSLQVEFDVLTKPKQLKVYFARGMLVVEFPAPTSDRAGMARGIFKMTEMTDLEFFLKYAMPRAEITPMDGNVEGGETVTIRARGWWGNGEMPSVLPSTDTIQIALGGKQPSQVVSVRQDRLVLEVVLLTPKSDVAETVSCTIAGTVDGIQLQSRFSFEYFKLPRISAISPRKATLSGITGSKEGNTIVITVQDFSRKAVSVGDLKLTFGQLECGIESSCSITSLENSFSKESSTMFITARVPTANVPGVVTVGVEQRLTESGRQQKQAFGSFSFFQPSPVASAMRWCPSCTPGARTCIVMGKCGDGTAPLKDLIPQTGGGVLVLSIDFPPRDFTYKEVDGSSPALISLALGSSGYGNFNRVAYGDGKLEKGFVEKSASVALELSLPTFSSVEGTELVISIKSRDALSPSVASRMFQFFDNRITITCLHGCSGPAHGSGETVVAVTNFLLSSDLAATDQVLAGFGDQDSPSIYFAQKHPDCPADATCLRLEQPACAECKFERGSLQVALSLSLKADPIRGSTTEFMYWAAPVVTSAIMDAQGTYIHLLFDQDTDRASMSNKDDDCAAVLDSNALTLLGDASCVWDAADSMKIYIDSSATIVPGDTLTIRRNGLRSSNKVSGPCVSIVAVSPPGSAIAPVVDVQKYLEIDPCSDLRVTAMVSSPRRVVYAWGCMNCQPGSALDAKLKTFNEARLYLGAGTSEMEELDKSYEISLIATDFLGTPSDLHVIRVFKKSAPAPLLSFLPASLVLYRDESQLVRVVASFSKCPIEKGKLIFEWTLKSGPMPDPTLFSVTGSQILIPSNTLQAGSVYTLGVYAYMDNDPSKASTGTYSIEVLSRPLIATIRGGALLPAMTTRQLVLDGSGSYDPDLQGAQDSELQFWWSCTIKEGGSQSPCRTKDGAQLILDSTPKIMLSTSQLANMYETSDTNPYVFTLQVSKFAKIPASFKMPVTLTQASIPAVSVEAGSGKQQLNGVVRVNSDEQVIVHGECSVLSKELKNNMEMHWHIQPPIAEELYDKLPAFDDDLGTRQTLVVLPNLGALIAGNSYTIELECIDTNGDRGKSLLSLTVNAPPSGSPCSACRLSASGDACSKSDPDSGEPIFDTFRFACDKWADPDGPLEYQFAYIGKSATGEPIEQIFDWSPTPSIDLVLPPGVMSLEARVRDTYGASTMWTDGGKLTVIKDDQAARRLLAAEDRWPESTTKLQESLDTENSALTNQLGSALAIEVEDRVQRGLDDHDIALRKKEILLQTLSTATTRAIKTEGYVCESLSVAKAISSNVHHISTGSVVHISTIARELLASSNARAISESCATDVLILSSKAFGATNENRTCSSDGFGVASGEHMRSFLSILDQNTMKILQKSSTSLLTGQKLSMQDSSSNSSGFTFAITKMSKTANLQGSIEGSRLHGAVFYSIPEEVQQDARISGHRSINVLFGTFSHPPDMNGTTPISPSVTLSLATEAGEELNISSLSHSINITIPWSAERLCGNETNVFHGQGRCMHWDAQIQTYSPAGCKTVRISDTHMTCMCNHLTSFIIEPDLVPFVPEPSTPEPTTSTPEPTTSTPEPTISATNVSATNTLSATNVSATNVSATNVSATNVSATSLPPTPAPPTLPPPSPTATPLPPPPPPSPPPPLLEDETIVLSVGLPISVDDFDASAQRKFIDGIAAAVGVDPSNVKILSIKPARRRAGIEVSVAVIGAKPDKLSADNINKELSARGLPKATVTVVSGSSNSLQIPGRPVATTPPPVQMEKVEVRTTVIAVACTLGAIVICMVLGAWFYIRKRFMSTKKWRSSSTPPQWSRASEDSFFTSSPPQLIQSSSRNEPEICNSSTYLQYEPFP